MPPSTRIDPLLAKAKSISDGDSTSEIPELRMGAKSFSLAVRERHEMRICDTNNSADTKVSGEGTGGAPGTRAEIPLQGMVRQLCPCSPRRITGVQRSTCNPWRITGMQRSTCSPWRILCWSRRMTKGSCDPMGTHAGAGSLEGLDPLWRTHTGEELSTMGGIHV
ncbi:hypothetical protein TURU_018696 [Turdus rufiventris]|nr:hypothetical protein TURU_018696 [Turdus rufiventris]